MKVNSKSRYFVSRVLAFNPSTTLYSGKTVIVIMMKRESLVMIIYFIRDPRSAHRLKGSVSADLKPEHLLLSP